MSCKSHATGMVALNRSTAEATAAVKCGPMLPAFDGRLNRMFPRPIRIKVKAIERS